MTVSIVGTTLTAVTDSTGHFSFASVPAGDLKLEVDGTTATNPPAGYYFPTMVMDLRVEEGMANTVMEAMQMSGTGNSTPGELLPTAPGVYLPRVASAILRTIAPSTGMTQVGITAAAAPDLTPLQASELTISAQSGTAIGTNGQPMSSYQIGVSTVPPSLVMDMLPPGELQHSFDITVQAPGVSVFAQPLPMTFPNVYNAAPGSKMNFLSYNHTSGRLEIEGTATVSADGLIVVTDPGTGITHPGWHFVATGSKNGDALQAQDPTKKDPKNIAELVKEYGPGNGGYVNADGTITTTTAIQIALAEAAYKTGSALAGQVGNYYFNNWLSGGGDLSASSPKNIIAAQEILADPNFQKLVVQADEQAILDQKKTNDGSGFTVDLTPHQFGFSSGFLNYADLQYAFNRSKPTDTQPQLGLSFKKVTGSGTISADGTKITGGTLTYTGSFVFGFGTDDAFSTSRSGASKLDFFYLRIAQLAGDAKAFTTTVSVTVPLPFPASPTPNVPPENSSSTVSESSPPTTTNTNVSTVSGFGNDPAIYYRFDLANGFTIFGKTESSGELGGVIFPATTDYTGTFYQPMTNSWTSVVGTSGPSGVPFGLGGGPSIISLDQFGGTDSTGDGIPDIGRYAIGLTVGVHSFAGDGIDDATKLEMGLDPRSGRAFPTGVVGSLPLSGTAEAIDVEGLTTSQGGQTAYIATGSTGLAIVNVTQFNNPIVLSQLTLGPTATGVAEDPNLQIAAVADNGGGLYLIDVSNPTSPKILNNINVNASKVKIVNDIAYAAVGSTLQAFDVATGTALGTLSLSGSIVGLAAEGQMIYTMDSTGTLRAIDVSGPTMVARGSLFVSGATGNIFVGNGIAYVSTPPNGSPNQGGFATVNVSNPSSLALIGAATSSNIAGLSMHANGSGLGVGVGSFVGTTGVLDVTDVSDPTKTNKFLTRVSLPAAPFDLAIASGIAYVADGTGGLQVVNYEAFDNKGVSPTVTASIPSSAQVTGSPGSIVAGASIPVSVNTADDVQVRNVELLVNGQVVQNSVSFPWNMSFVAPAAAGPITVQVEVFDTGGNAAMSNVINLSVVPDTVAPTVLTITPAAGGQVFAGLQNLTIGFSKPIQTTGAASSAFKLYSAGADGILGTADDVQVSLSSIQFTQRSTIVVITTGGLPVGNYQLRVDRSQVTDRAGNVLGTGTLTNNFQVAAFSVSPDFLPFGTQLPTFADDVSIAIPAIPFSFSFFGQPITGQINITSNGVVELGTQAIGGNYINGNLPYGAFKGIAAYWDDLYPPTAGRIGYYDADGVRAITWQGLPYYSRGSTPTVTFQVAMYSNGTIIVRYGAMGGPPNGTATIGIQSGSVAVVPSAGALTNQPASFGITTSAGILDTGGLARLNSLSGVNNILVYTPDNHGSYTVAFNPLSTSTTPNATISTTTTESASDQIASANTNDAPVPSTNSQIASSPNLSSAKVTSQIAPPSAKPAPKGTNPAKSAAPAKPAAPLVTPRLPFSTTPIDAWTQADHPESFLSGRPAIGKKRVFA